MSGRSDIEKALKLYIDHLKTINFKHTFLTIICIFSIVGCQINEIFGSNELQIYIKI